MRTEEEMLQLILSVAQQDERIRVVAMNGSRTNLQVPKDFLQDYDVVFIVTELESFLSDGTWVDVFGERIIMQMPDAMAMFSPEPRGRFAYLMLFVDGNRIDLTLIPLGQAEDYAKEDSLTVLLLDKDNRMPSLPPPTDKDYWIKPPSEEFFSDCCNEFWWVSTYVAKGLWRKEITYAKSHLDGVLRRMLMQMLEWKVGSQTDFTVSAGKCGKYLKGHLPQQNWDALIATYADGSYDATWEALFAACNLFRETAIAVAAHFSFDYPIEDDRLVRDYLDHIRMLARGSHLRPA